MEAKDTSMFDGQVGSINIFPWASSVETTRFFFKLKGEYSEELQKFGEEAYKAGYEERNKELVKWARTHSYVPVETALAERIEGIREVVEWIRSANHSGDFYYSFDQAELAAKVKEWGIEEL